MEQFAPGGTFQLILFGKELSGINSAGTVTVSYGEGRTHKIDHPLFLETKPVIPNILLPATSLSRQESCAPGVLSPMAAALFTTSITVAWRSKRVQFDTGPLDRVFVAMNKCTNGLFAVWKLDEAEQLKPQQTRDAA
jgi:hypothetical protein